MDFAQILDLIQSIFGFGLSIPIMIIIYQNYCDKKSGIKSIPAITTAIPLTIMTVTSGLLNLYFITASQAISSFLWYIIFFQGLYYKYYGNSDIVVNF